MSAKALIMNMPAAFNSAVAGDVQAVIQYNISEPMHAKICDGVCTVHNGTSDDPSVTLTASDEDLSAILKGELDGVSAFMAGKLQIDGDIMLAQRMNSFFDVNKI